MFSTNHGDAVLPIRAERVPTTEWQPPTRRGADPPPPQQLPTLFFGATRNTRKGTLYLKVVNTAATAQSVQIDLKGIATITAEGRSIVLTSSSPTDTNSITEPKKIVPVAAEVKGLGTSFAWSFSPYSVTILQLETR
jgi:alpha-N-arabinofuranosidase